MQGRPNDDKSLQVGLHFSAPVSEIALMPLYADVNYTTDSVPHDILSKSITTQYRHAR